MSEQDQLKLRFARLNEQRDLHRKHDVAADVVPAKTVAPVADDEMTFAKLGLAVVRFFWKCINYLFSALLQGMKNYNSERSKLNKFPDKEQSNMLLNSQQQKEYFCPSYKHLSQNVHYRSHDY